MRRGFSLLGTSLILEVGTEPKCWLTSDARAAPSILPAPLTTMFFPT